MQINQSLNQLKRSLGITKKDIRIYYQKGPVITFGLLMPLFLFLAFLIGNRDLSTIFSSVGFDRDDSIFHGYCCFSDYSTLGSSITNT